MHRRPALLAVAVAVAALTGCVVQPPPIATPVEAAWRVDTRVVSYPLILGDVAVAYTSDGVGDLALTAWTADGTEAWSHPAAPLYDGTLVDLVPLVGGAVLPFLTPAPEGVTWMAVDIADGTPAPWTGVRQEGATAWELVYQTWRCGPGDDPGGICFSVPDGTDVTAEFLRMRPDVGIDDFPFPIADVTVFATDRGVFTNASDEAVELLVDGSRRWSRPWSDISDAEFSDGGLLVTQVDDVLVVTTYAGLGTGSDDVSGYASAGIDAASGAVLWRLPGAFSCGYGSTLLLCTGTGAVTDTSADWQSIAITSIDVRTGSERWRLDMGTDGLAVENAADGWTWYGDSVVVPDEQSVPTIVDAASGDRRAVPDGAALPCATGAGETLPWGDVAIPVSESVAWCTAPGQAVADPSLHADVVSAIGLPLGDVLLVPEPGALVAYRVG